MMVPLALILHAHFRTTNRDAKWHKSRSLSIISRLNAKWWEDPRIHTRTWMKLLLNASVHLGVRCV